MYYISIGIAWFYQIRNMGLGSVLLFHDNFVISVITIFNTQSDIDQISFRNILGFLVAQMIKLFEFGIGNHVIVSGTL